MDKEEKALAKRMLKPTIIAKLIKMYSSLCNQCREHTSKEIQVGRSIVMEDLCEECRNKAEPVLTEIQGKI